MDGDSSTPRSGSQASSPQTTGPALSRAQRGAIAAQACDTCRSRKQKCDEQRPKCGTCQKFKLGCRYREPQPTKKDKTLVEILERMKTIEDKIDNLSAQGLTSPVPPSVFGGPLVQTPAPIAGGSSASGSSSALLPTPLKDLSRASGISTLYKYASSVRAVLAWPVVHELMKAVSPSTSGLDPAFTAQQDGVSFLLGAPQSIPLAPPGSTFGRHPSLDPPALGSSPAIPPVLNALGWEAMQTLTKAFFDTYNLLHPIVDRHAFVSITLPAIMANGLVLDDSVQSTLAYLVFALGEVAVDAYNDPSQRLSRGNVAQPPGLVFFNEARRRMGFNLTECSLENVQIFALAGSFSPELGMPITGLDKYEALVRVPDFGGVLSQEDYVSNQASHYQEHFASQIVLRRLSADFHTVLSSVSSAPAMPGAIKPLAMQLDQWRETLLPTHLRWREDDPGSLPNSDHNVYDTLAYQAVPDIGADPHPIPTAAGLSMFTADLDIQPVAYPYATDIQVALLRTRYYITKHMIYRPFLYKALHHADQMTQEDAEGVAHCLRACLKWPLTMSPACTRKRLIPCIFFWTQNLLGVLIILHLSEQVPILLRIRTSGICGERFDVEASETIRLAIQWIRDLKDADSASEWAWGVVKAIYKLDE
ncbi:Zinc finger transcription factor YRR1 [Cytospora mali]|uniref:Zinc finger transcription factor YRR1 n=1 Tax=Cytospora mali TaxID=578113 RepID=A0A194V1N1_CYTMA|nr:Zinc finger transcription factor YRR1 [Valsa mali var. pyri (nom. inval.)]